MVCSNATLEAIAALKPQSRDALLGVPGIGPARADKYGTALLAAVAVKHTPLRR